MAADEGRESAVALGLLPAKFGTMEVRAGVVQRGDVLEIALKADLRRVSRFRAGEIDGRPVEIVKPFYKSSVRDDLVEAVVRYVEELPND